ncbi:MAG: amino acid adenylation domain-containing protein [Arcobacter sp.]|nr:amino acid adenylation domain-containing protein [Arcobacter sp.]
MKVLKVLLHSSLNDFSYTLISYLIDAGHFVYILGNDNEGQNWAEKFHFNINILSPNEIKDFHFDCFLDFNGLIEVENIKKIRFYIDLLENELVISCLLVKNTKIYELASKTVCLINLSSFVNENLNYFLEEIESVFIEGIVSILRADTQSLNCKKIYFAKRQNFIEDFVGCLEGLKKLFALYDDINIKNDIFSIKDLFINKSKNNRNYKTYLVDLNNKGIKFNENILEIFGLYIISLLNAKTQGMYGYDLKLCDKHNFNNQKLISKFINLQKDLSYLELLESIRADQYNVTKNKFFIGSVRNTIKNNDILFSYGQKPDEFSYKLKINYDDDHNKLQIIVIDELHFFEDIENYALDFCNKFNQFSCNGRNFNYLLDIPNKCINKVIVEFNKTDVEKYLDFSSICILFQEKVKKFPDKIVLIYNGVHFSYRNINEKANQVANYIQRIYKIKSGDFVAILLDRNELMIIGILAVIKLGASYIPFDQRYPNQRIKGILTDTRAKLLIMNEQYKGRLAEDINKNICKIFIYDRNNVKFLSYSNTNLNINYDSKDVLYTTYTSGSTGEPKGISIENCNVTNILMYIASEINFTHSDVLLCVTNITFDIAVLEIFMPLINGATIVMLDKADLLNGENLIKLIKDHNVSTIQATPSLWKIISQSKNFSKLNIKALSGGEELSLYLTQILLNKVNALWNVYGPTETTIWSTLKKVTYKDKKIYIGKPISNTKCYILDELLSPLPIGVIGELCISGIGLSKGYLNNPNLTQEKFVDNPFLFNIGTNKSMYSKLYKTGDYVRWTNDGNIEYIGRSDTQIKMRGFRIELGEIESVMLKYNGINQAVVILKHELTNFENENKYLVAYYVSNKVLDEKSVIDFLKSELPEYMVPSALVYLEELPLTINNKIDKSKLPDIKRSYNCNFHPRDELEMKLWEIWSEILNLRDLKPNIENNFFSSGGNSILAIRLTSKINNEFESDVKIRDIFSTQTIKALAPMIKNSVGEFKYKPFLIFEIDEENLFYPFSLNNIQQSYYLGRSSNFELSNISTHIYSEYIYKKLDLDKLEKSLNLLIERHLALRTIFVNGYQQYLKEYSGYKIKLYNLNSEDELIELRDQYSHKVYDPSIFPLFDVFVSKLGYEYVLHISFDALIIDMSSFQILFKEWQELYNNPDLELKKLNVSHRDYIFQCERIRQSELFYKCSEYWLNKLKEYNFNVNLPLKTNPFEIANPKFERISKVIPCDKWNKLLKKLQDTGISATSLILSIYARVICYWSGQEQLCLNLSLFNRLPLHPQINDIIGDFTVLELFDYHDNNLVSITKKLNEIHEKLWEDIDHSLFDGIDFFRLIREKNIVSEDKAIAPIVLTSMLGQNALDLSLNNSHLGVKYAISQTAQLWLDNKAYETEKGFIAEWDYVSELFDKNEISQMHHIYCSMIEYFAEVEWSNTSFPKIDNFVNQLTEFRENRKNQNFYHVYSASSDIYEDFLFPNTPPEKISILDLGDNKNYSYNQLNRQISLFAKYIIRVCELKNIGIENNNIYVLLESTYHMILTRFALMKSGYPFLDIDYKIDTSSLEKILKDNFVNIIIVSRKFLELKVIPIKLLSNFEVIVIEDILEEFLVNLDLKNDLNKIKFPLLSWKDIACIKLTLNPQDKIEKNIFSYADINNQVETFNNTFSLKGDDNVLLLNDYLKETDIFYLFSSFMKGSTLIVCSSNDLKKYDYKKIIEKYEITFWYIPLKFAYEFIEYIEQEQCFCKLKIILKNKNNVQLHLPYKLKKLFPESQILILHIARGYLFAWNIVDETLDKNCMLKGRLLNNQILEVLNHYYEVCPLNVYGKIFIQKFNKFELNEEGDSINNLSYLYDTNCVAKFDKSGFIEIDSSTSQISDMHISSMLFQKLNFAISEFQGIKESFILIQNEKNKKYLVLYVVPDSTEYSKTRFKYIDENEFRLSRKGVLTHLKPKYHITPIINENDFRSRKSYRNFEAETVDLEVIRTTCNEVIEDVKKSNQVKYPKKKLNGEILNKIFSPISGIELDDRLLIKYKYPSGGSTYSIRCFFYLDNDLEHISKGYYYYNPIDYSLCDCDASLYYSEKLNFKLQGNTLYFIVNWPSIKPLYGELSKRFVYIEVGHMISLISEELSKNSINYCLSVEELDLDEDNTLVAKIILKDGSKFSNIDLGFNYLIKNDIVSFKSIQNSIQYDLDKTSIFDRAPEFENLLSMSNALISIDGKYNKENLVLSGFLFQKISELLCKKNIGSCMLGFTPYKKSLYLMAVGKITFDEKCKSNSLTDTISLSEIISRRAQRTLKNSIFFHKCFVIEHLPFISQDFIDFSKLPKIEEVDDNNIVAPKNDNEQKIAKIWSEVLEIPLSEIGINNNFFRLGGNSLLAMQLIGKLNRDLGSKYKVSDIYKYKNIEKLVQILAIDNVNKEVEGRI